MVDLAQSAEAVKTILLGKTTPYQRWLPSPTLRYWGNDQRLFTQVGRRRGFALETTHQAGFLFYGPYRSLEAGRQTLLKERGQKDIGPWTADYEFQLTQSVKDLEFRLLVSASSDLGISAIEIEPLTF